MRRLLLFIACLSIFSISVAQNIYKDKSGKIVYRYEIGSEKTDFTLMFDNYGKKQIMDINQIVDGENQHVKTIITETEMLVINYADKQVIKFPVTQDNSAGGFEQGIDVAELVKAAKSAGGSQVGTETILGKNCVVFQQNIEGAKGKFWIYDNHLLKAEFVDAGVHTLIEVKAFEMGISISASEFKAPAGYAVTDMSQMQQMMQMFGAPE